MINYTLRRKLYFIKSVVANHFKEHQTYYILGFVCFLLFFITGVFSAIKYSEVVSLSDIADKTLVGFLLKDVSIFGLIFSRIIGYLFLTLLTVLISGIIFLFPIGYLILIYNSFISALTITFFIILYGFSGVVLSLLVLIPVTICFSIFYIALLATCVKRTFYCKRFGGVYFNNQAPDYLFTFIKLVLVGLFVVCLWQLLMLPIVSNIFVIIV